MSIDRRRFLRSITGATGATAAAALVPGKIVPFENPTARTDLPEVIVALEKEVAAHPGQFIWSLHNELRHQYINVDEATSRKHADIILKHSFMDGYILSTLNDWHIDHGNPHDGIVTLTANAYRYDYLVHLHTACLVRAGMEYREYLMTAEANDLFRRVTNNGLLRRVVTTLEPYHRMAEQMILA
ncbi:MAG: hypothetical protein AAF653_00160 [Chloroflexota bacterium]